MLIPHKFRIKRNVYRVHGGRPRSWLRGKTHHDERRMWVYDKDKMGNDMLPDEKRETFFHELTHAVLYEMKNPLWCNEQFVDEFARLLTQAINTSEFKQR